MYARIMIAVARQKLANSRGLEKYTGIQNVRVLPSLSFEDGYVEHRDVLDALLVKLQLKGTCKLLKLAKEFEPLVDASPQDNTYIIETNEKRPCVVLSDRTVGFEQSSWEEQTRRP